LRTRAAFCTPISAVNFLLDKNLDLKVTDFAGASIDGENSWSFYRITHRLPDTDGKDRLAHEDHDSV
jgi:hypothetical protein